MSHATSWCPECRIDLEDDGLEVRCWRCGWSVSTITDPNRYADYADEIRQAAIWGEQR